MLPARSVLLGLCVVARGARGALNGLDARPPLGWSNWESVGCDVDEAYVRANARALVDTGLAALGYASVNVDDCWAEADRDAQGHLVPHRGRFPSGIKALADFVHGLDLRFGLYSSAGGHCCQHTMPGSLGYEWIDASDFAAWGVDFLKYDGCFMEEAPAVLGDFARRFPFTPPPVLRYPAMAAALNATGRDIGYECNFPWQFWGLGADAAQGGRWVAEVCNSWRVAGDAQPGFANALSYVDEAERFADAVPSGPGHWAHLDSLEIGNNASWDALSGGGRAFARGGGAMTAPQEEAVFSLYAVVKTPLIIGADVTRLKGHSLAAYANAEVIAVHQDALGAAGRRIAGVDDVWGVRLSGDAFCAVVLNRGAEERAVQLTFAQLGLAGRAYAVRDLWAKKDLGNFTTAFGAKVQGTAALTIKLTPLKTPL